MILQDTTWVITGASAGIGAALAQVAAQEGDTQLFLVARRLPELEKLSDKLTGQYPQLSVHCLQVDLLIPDGNCSIDIVSNFFLNSIKSVYLSK